MQLLQVSTLRESPGRQTRVEAGKFTAVRMKLGVQGYKDSKLLSHRAREERAAWGESSAERLASYEEAAGGQRKQKRRKLLEGLERKMLCNHTGP